MWRASTNSPVRTTAATLAATDLCCFAAKPPTCGCCLFRTPVRMKVVVLMVIPGRPPATGASFLPMVSRAALAFVQTTPLTRALFFSRQMDELADQARVSHWAARAEALDRLSQLLTSGGGGDGIGTGGEGGRFVLESRPASRRLEVVIAERARDANFRVVTAALKVLGALVEAHPMLMAGHASALLPSVSQDTTRNLA